MKNRRAELKNSREGQEERAEETSEGKATEEPNERSRSGKEARRPARGSRAPRPWGSRKRSEKWREGNQCFYFIPGE